MLAKAWRLSNRRKEDADLANSDGSVGSAYIYYLPYNFFRTVFLAAKVSFYEFLEREVVVIKTIHEMDPSLEKTTTRSKDGGVAIHTFQVFLLVPIK